MPESLTLYSMHSLPTKIVASLLSLAGVFVGVSSFGDLALAPAPLPPVEKPLRVLFTGDIMLDRNVAKWGEADPAALFASSSHLFAGVDLVVVNLEGTITQEESIARKNSSILRFTFKPDFVRTALAPLRISAASLANNHALDFGGEGYDETRQRLAELNIAPFGHPLNASGTLSTVLSAQDKRVCLVGYHSLFSAAVSGVVAEIERLRSDCYRIAVVAHWGDEYVERTAAQQEQGRAFIDAGADVVVGAHPHVVQSMEVYRGKAIFYSLGNFMFDQEFSSATQNGLVVEARFYPHKVTYVLVPTQVVGGRSFVAQGEDRRRTLELFHGVDTITLP